MNTAYLSLGSNRGVREKNLEKAIAILNKDSGKIVRQSSLYETQPWKMEDDTYFINQVVLLETELTAVELMQTIMQVEKSMGRVRPPTPHGGRRNWYASRIIDIDILFFNNECINNPDITIPHPLLQERRFVLIPMCEIAAEYIHPVLQKSMTDLLKQCKDKGTVVSGKRL